MDEELYKQYLNGDKNAFDKIYEKYRNKIIYYIFKIVNDYSKAEDLAQEVFVYILNNKFDENNANFKYYIYLIAKSKALNYIKIEKRRNEIMQKELNCNQEIYEIDLLEKMIEKEDIKSILKAIESINEKYREALYLSKVENLSYREIASILNIQVYDVKNYIHRGNKELKRKLIDKTYKNIIKNIIVFLIVIVLFSGVTYAVTRIYRKYRLSSSQTIPTFLDSIGENDFNKLWVGTFQLVWNEYSNNIIKSNIEFEDGESLLANELNKQLFNSSMISEKDYYVKVGITSPKLKEEIINDVNKKFGINDISLLNEISFENNQEQDIYTLFAILFKDFRFIYKFDQLYSDQFNNDEKVKYFGINNASSEELNENVKVLFYIDKEDYAVSLKTQDNEELILYCNNENESFDYLYKEILEKESNFVGNKIFSTNDEIKIPYINLDTTINYGELCGRAIKSTNKYISSAIQKVKFQLNERGGNLTSMSILKDAYLSANDGSRYFYFDKPFVMFLKEDDKSMPYFALKIDNAELLIKE